MIDHPLSDAVGALRTSLEAAMLERQAVEERFSTDALVGDTRWETSYTLPGEAHPARCQADLSVGWPTWSQSSYRTWNLTGELQNVPELDIEIVFRAQDLRQPPIPRTVLDRLPPASPRIGKSLLERRGGPTLESTYDADGVLDEHAVEVTYGGTIELAAEILADGNLLDDFLSALGGWVSSTLVALDDLL